MRVIIEILLLIDGVVYNLVDYVYGIFDFLARLNIFSESDYNDIVGRIYIVLGVVMLFVLAYTLLRAIINPDEMSKGERSFATLAKNVVISIALIVLMPTIFKIAFNIQNAILNTGTITTLILGDTNMKYTEVYDDETIVMSPGRMIAVNTFSSFFYPNPIYCAREDYSTDTLEEIEACKDTIESDGFIFHDELTFREVDRDVKRPDTYESMLAYTKFGKAVKEDKINYYMIVSTACGIFLLYVLLNFCFDLALRVIKLMFYQLIAPIPIVCRIIPFGKFKEVFSTWLKQVTSVFVEVFMRIAIMNFGVLMIKLTCQTLNGHYRSGLLSLPTAAYNLSWLQFKLAKVLLILGIVMFVRKAPELLSKLFGIDTGGMSLNLRDKLRDSGVYAAGAAIGAGGGMLLRNGANAFGNIRDKFREERKSKDGQPGKSVAGALWASRGEIGRGIRSTVAGTVAGGARAGYQARNAKNAEEMRSATNAAVEKSTKNRDKRAQYRAAHRNGPGGVIGAHVNDSFADFKQWLDGGLTKYDEEEKFIKSVTAAVDDLDSSKDTLYSRNSNNSLIQKAYMKNMREAAEENLRTVGDSFDPNKEGGYKDAFGNAVIVNNDAEFAAYKTKLQQDIDALRSVETTALDKTAMDNFLKGKQDDGYHAEIETNFDSLYLEARRLRNAALDSSGHQIFEAGKEYKDAYGNVVAISNQAEYDNYINNLDNEITGIVAAKNRGDDIKDFINNRRAAGYNVSLKNKEYMLKDLYGREVAIKDEGSYYSYLSLIEKQIGDIDRGSKKLIAGYAVEGNNDALSAMGLDTNSTDRTLIKEMGTKARNVEGIVSESPSLAASINGGTMPELGSYKDISSFKDSVKERASVIFAEKAKLQREKEARDANRKS